MRVTFPCATALALMLAGVSQPAIAQDGGAYIAKDQPCGGFIPTASGGIGPIIYSTDGAVVIKGNGSTSLSCHFIIPAELMPRTTTRAAGFLCNTWLGPTNDSRMQASSGGNATLTCRIRTKVTSLRR